MSYVSAEKILPKELIEQIQQYVSGKSIYIPSREKKKWGSETKTKQFYTERNREICIRHINGLSVKALAAEYALSEKSIERIIRTGKMKTYSYIALAEKPDIKESAAEWFSKKWGIPKEAYLECMESYLKGETVYGWYLCFEGAKRKRRGNISSRPISISNVKTIFLYNLIKLSTLYVILSYP